ncbi:MAG: hypothetical protein MZW92_05130 [Comamonadaceae bacterium]|nr:hypothetical protein [Comamonadaceae bacterium]
MTLASRDLGLRPAHRVAAAEQLTRLRLYASDDVSRRGGRRRATNVLAIAAGIPGRPGLRAERPRRAAHPRPGGDRAARRWRCGEAGGATFMGLAGMGDVVLTRTGDLSLAAGGLGLALAKGQPLDGAILQDLGQTAEGVGTARAVASLAERSRASTCRSRTR